MPAERIKPVTSQRRNIRVIRIVGIQAITSWTPIKLILRRIDPDFIAPSARRVIYSTQATRVLGFIRAGGILIIPLPIHSKVANSARIARSKRRAILVRANPPAQRVAHRARVNSSGSQAVG